MSGMAKRKMKKMGKITIVRRVVQVAVIMLFCTPLLVAGNGLIGTTSGLDELPSTASSLPFFGSLSSSTIFGITIMDPYAALQVTAASLQFTTGLLIASLPALIFYGIVRGRAFCGWACPVNFMLEGLDWLRGKLHLKVVAHALPRCTKMVVSVIVLVLCAITGKLVFEMFSPIAFLNRGLLFGVLIGSGVFVAIVIAELFWAQRVWCRAICPLGGFYEVLGEIGLVSVKMDAEKCIRCDECRKVCLCDPQILDGVLDRGAKHVTAGDCMLCGKCVDLCPTDALSIGFAVPFPKQNA